MVMKRNHIFIHQLIILFKMIILYNLGLKNCENILKDYFNLDYLNITVNYLNYEIYKGIIIYNTDYTIIVLLNDITFVQKKIYIMMNH